MIYISDGTDEKTAISRTTHLAISAHQDDIEFMAYAPIAECFGNQDKDDAKTVIINTIIVKDLSRFVRNYIEVGQYVDYVFPAFGIRFIAIQDNVDTENRDSGAMERMPIMNVFNEWHAANTSKKIRAVLKSNAREGKYHARKAPYGYVKSDTEKKTPIIDEEAAAVVKRIFEMRASGLSPHKIADILNEENSPNPSKYSMDKYGIVGKRNHFGLWSFVAVNSILKTLHI